MANIEETQDLTSIQWRSPEWLSVFGLPRPENVLDYFAESPFWDNQSNNQILKMQSQHTGMRIDTIHELKKLTGKEFVVVQSNPPYLYVIRKQIRRSSTEVRPLSTYYILNENIYQAPDLYSVLQNKMYTALHHLQGTWRTFPNTRVILQDNKSNNNLNQNLITLDSSIAMERALRDTQRHIFNKARENAAAVAAAVNTSLSIAQSPVTSPQSEATGTPSTTIGTTTTKSKKRANTPSAGGSKKRRQ